MGKIEVEESLILDSLAKRRSTVIQQDKQSAAMLEKTQKRDAIRKISTILRKPDAERTADDRQQLATAPAALLKHAAKLQTRVDQSKQRLLEQEDPYEAIDRKARQLAAILSSARHLVCYTGAGISTAARIPDYRGTNGIWTRLQKGEQIGQHDLSQAEPTFTHMALYELHRQRILQYVLSQNCDGLHLRSGLPREALSEVHGNMYVEVCKACSSGTTAAPHEAVYWRLFDTTEATARYCHRTNRQCRRCGKSLHDTIVHFGERGSLKWPLNWDGASRHAERADVILCLGSSLKVLKKYSWLWQMDRPRGKRPKLCIVNLQWTPKDAFADLKVNGKCDEVMALVMRYMGVPVRRYSRVRDPLFAHATPLTAEEEHTKTQPTLRWEAARAGEADDDEDELTTATEGEEDETTSEVFDDDGDDGGSYDEEQGDEDFDGLSGEDDDSSAEDDDKKSIKLEPDDTAVVDDAIKAEQPIEADAKPKPLKLERPIKTETDLPTTTNGATIKQESDDCLPIKTETTNDSAVVVINLISDSDESNSMCSATTATTSSNDNNTPAAAVRVPTGKVRVCPPQTPTPPPPVPFFQTSPLGLRTISPQRRATSPTPTPTATRSAPAKRPPYWYEPNYAYGGLHSIVAPAPLDAHLFRTATKSSLQLNGSQAECAFCLGHYAEMRCLFYRPQAPEHAHARRTADGRRLVCDCCDETTTATAATAKSARTRDDIAVDDSGSDQASNGAAAEATLAAMLDDDGDGDGDVVDDEQSNEACNSSDAPLLQENTTDDSTTEAPNSAAAECGGSAEKRARLADGSANEKQAAAAAAVRVQPGWYGKGYRKSRRRRRM